jgi:hypothetical protein
MVRVAGAADGAAAVVALEILGTTGEPALAHRDIVACGSARVMRVTIGAGTKEGCRWFDMMAARETSQPSDESNETKRSAAMTSKTPVRGDGFGHKLAAIWADIAYAQLRMIEHNRPGAPRR